jgi:hypothetical protein
MAQCHLAQKTRLYRTQRHSSCCCPPQTQWGTTTDRRANSCVWEGGSGGVGLREVTNRKSVLSFEKVCPTAEFFRLIFDRCEKCRLGDKEEYNVTQTHKGHNHHSEGPTAWFEIWLQNMKAVPVLYPGVRSWPLRLFGSLSKFEA